MTARDGGVDAHTLAGMLLLFAVLALVFGASAPHPVREAKMYALGLVLLAFALTAAAVAVTGGRP